MGAPAVYLERQGAHFPVTSEKLPNRATKPDGSLVAHHGYVACMMEELVHVAQISAGTAQHCSVNGAVHVADDVEQHHCSENPRQPSGNISFA